MSCQSTSESARSALRAWWRATSRGMSAAITPPAPASGLPPSARDGRAPPLPPSRPPRRSGPLGLNLGVGLLRDGRGRGRGAGGAAAEGEGGQKEQEPAGGG